MDTASGNDEEVDVVDALRSFILHGCTSLACLVFLAVSVRKNGQTLAPLDRGHPVGSPSDWGRSVAIPSAPFALVGPSFEATLWPALADPFNPGLKLICR